MTFKRFVEVGRVCLITYGPNEGKLCTIINMIDQGHVLVDGTGAGEAGCTRMGISVKRLMLTDLTVSISLNSTRKCDRPPPPPPTPLHPSRLVATRSDWPPRHTANPPPGRRGADTHPPPLPLAGS